MFSLVPILSGNPESATRFDSGLGTRVIFFHEASWLMKIDKNQQLSTTAQQQQRR